jgi:preprotein translocase subunit SecD
MKRILTSFISIALLTVGSLSVRADEAKSFTLNQLESQSSGHTVDLTQPEGGEPLHIDKQPVLTQKDFEQAKVVRRNGKTVLQVTLTGSGAALLKEFSSGHVGQKLAVVMGEHVVAAPVIRTAIGQEFEVDGLSKSDAEKFAQLINHKNLN